MATRYLQWSNRFERVPIVRIASLGLVSAAVVGFWILWVHRLRVDEVLSRLQRHTVMTAVLAGIVAAAFVSHRRSMHAAHLRTRLISRGATLLLATHSLDIVEHHADRAALLVDGRLQRIWEPSDLAQLRSAGQRFDDALARSMRSATACRAHCSVTLKNVP